MSELVLVTGGSGFIGSHVVDRLLASGRRARILDTRPSPWHDRRAVETVIGDIRRLDDVRRAVNGCDAVCHLAAAADVGEVEAHPAWATELNANGTLNVLEAARDLGVPRIIYASTVWVYSEVEADAVDETTLVPHPAHLYTAGKLSGELFCRSYAELYGLAPTIVRFGIPYGPRARPAAVIPSFVDRVRRGEPLAIAGTGEQERSFVYVEDLADGVVKALAPDAAGRTYNLAGRETVTIRRLAEIVTEELGGAGIVHTEGRAADLRGARVDSARAERELGWVAATPLREGIRRYADWVESQGTTAVPPTIAPAPSGPGGVPPRRAVLRRLADGPALAGAIASLAVASASISAILGAGEEAQSADLTVLAVAILMPLWTVTVGVWPAALRRAQKVLAATLGAVGVVVIGVANAGPEDRHFDASKQTLVLVLSLMVASVLRIVPRRLGESRA